MQIPCPLCHGKVTLESVEIAKEVTIRWSCLPCKIEGTSRIKAIRSFATATSWFKKV